MTAEQVNFIRDSYVGLASRAELVALLFYKRLFELAPRLQPLFGGDIEIQTRKFIELLELGVLLADSPDLLVPHLESLGRRHALYGITDEDYRVVGQALLWSLAEALGPELSPEGVGAWAAFYQLLAATMQNGTALGESWRRTETDFVSRPTVTPLADLTPRA